MTRTKTYCFERLTVWVESFGTHQSWHVKHAKADISAPGINKSNTNLLVLGPRGLSYCGSTSVILSTCSRHCIISRTKSSGWMHSVFLLAPDVTTDHLACRLFHKHTSVSMSVTRSQEPPADSSLYDFHSPLCMTLQLWSNAHLLVLPIIGGLLRFYGSSIFPCHLGGCQSR